MCGRFTLRTPTDRLVEIFALNEALDLPLRFNIAPTQDLAAIRGDEDDQRHFCLLRWGLVPSWAKDPSIGNRMINARAESVAEKPAFRAAFRRRRCLVPADGYYEWQKQGQKKQPFYIHRRDDLPFAFAGLWENWSGTQPPLESCTLITTDANELTRPIHDRMPVIIAPENYREWLDPRNNDVQRLQALLRPYAEDELQADPVSTYVNNPRNEGPQCIAVQKDLF